MNDAVFKYEEDKLLKKRNTPIRERLLKQLEFRALLDEIAESVDIRNDDLPMGSDAYRYVIGGQ